MLSETLQLIRNMQRKEYAYENLCATMVFLVTKTQTIKQIVVIQPLLVNTEILNF